VLGDIVDKTRRRGLVLADGSLVPFVTRPLSAVLALIVLLVLMSQVPAARRLWQRITGSQGGRAS